MFSTSLPRPTELAPVLSRWRLMTESPSPQPSPVSKEGKDSSISYIQWLACLLWRVEMASGLYMAGSAGPKASASRRLRLLA